MFEGRIFVDEILKKPVFILDAEPHIMSRIRKIFETARPYNEQGEFTHRPVFFPITLTTCRDLKWILERYKMEVPEEVLELIEEKAKAHDQILEFVKKADEDNSFEVREGDFKLALSLRDHQIRFRNMFLKVKRMLLADKMGAGKTASALSTLIEKDKRPALIVVPSHLSTQWEKEVKRFLPEATTHVIRGFKTYPLKPVDVLITSYNRLSPWADVLLEKDKKFKTLIFDEAHELRHLHTKKRETAYKLSLKTPHVLGLSGTPIFNMGIEIWSVLDCIRPNCLGDIEDFKNEWCLFDKVLEPSTLNSFLKKQGLLLRRTDEELGLNVKEPSKNVITLDADLEKLKEVKDTAKLLALSVLSNDLKKESESLKEFDWRLRNLTGVIKAKSVAEFTRMVLEEEEKVLLVGWHREVYSIWEKELKNFKVVKYTGSENQKEKEEAIKQFVEGDARVFILSLRSGAGIDGLQKASSTVIFGELDWSPHVLDQVTFRLAREGQKKHVQAFYLTLADGSDPFMMQTLGKKRSQHEGVIEGSNGDAELLADTVDMRERIREMAKAYLKTIGEEVPEEGIKETGLLKEVGDILRRVRVLSANEAEMQEALEKVLSASLKDAEVKREVKISSRSRLDFLITRNEEKVAIECKIHGLKRAEVYRQVKRYVEDLKVSGLILLAPWHGINSFLVEETPVSVIDISKNQI